MLRSLSNAIERPVGESRFSRRYHIELTDDIGGGVWTKSALGEIAPDSEVTTLRDLNQLAAPHGFYRIRATLPLAP